MKQVVQTLAFTLLLATTASAKDIVVSPGDSLEKALDATERPISYPLLNPPPGITPATTRGEYGWSFPSSGSSDPNLPSRLPRRSWTQAEREAYERRVDWLHKAKFGLFFDFLAGGRWTPAEWNKWVDDVNVDVVADQAQAVGAGYVVITLGQNQQYSCAPNPVIDELWGNHYTSKRDLPMDLYEALHRRGIAMMLYIATDNQFKMPRPPDMTGASRFDDWVKVCQWYSDHYGTRCKGWWVDGLNTDWVPGYRVNLTQSLKHGNPDALVASGQYEISDFLHGHCTPDWSGQSRRVKPFFGRWDPDFDIQWHALLHLGHTWGAADSPKTTDSLVQYASDVVRGGGVITFDIGSFTEGFFGGLPKDCATGVKLDGSRIGPFLEIPPGQFRQLQAVGEALKRIPVSDGSGAVGSPDHRPPKTRTL